MLLIKFHYVLLFIIFPFAISAQQTTIPTPRFNFPADSSAKLRIHQVRLSGNIKTKNYIVLREIQYHQGDSIAIAVMAMEMELGRQQVYNTGLFNEVKVAAAMVSATEIDILVVVKERWSFYPLPEFQPFDRNLNEWLVRYKGNLSRVNYGLKLVEYNLTGRRDPLRIYLINGYTRTISFSYAQPFFDKALTKGFQLGAGYAQSRELAYITSYDNKVQFYKAGKFVRDNLFFTAGYTIRKAIRSRHIFTITYTKTAINDSIASPAYNPDYFKDGATAKSFIDLGYTYRYTNVNNISYPLTGAAGFATVGKRGLGFTGGTNLFFVEGGYSKYKAISKNWWASIQLTGKIKLPFDQPYINQRAIGYGEAYLRGLEYYVVDGSVYGIAKSTVKKKLISFAIPLPFRSGLMNTIPFTIYAKAFTDMGYAHNVKKYDTFLNNKFLYTEGVGIDIITVYDISIKLDYSFNQLGQKGLFLHIQSGF